MVELPSIEKAILVLQKCRKRRELWHAKHVYIHLCENGLETTAAIGNHIVPIFVECGGVLEAEKVFRKLVHQNVYSWTAVLSGFSEHEKLEHAFELCEKMKEANVHPSSHTFVVLLKACAALKDVERGRKVHLYSAEKGFAEDFFVSSCLIDMYFKCGLPSEACDVFDALLVRDVVLWNTVVSGYVEHGCFEGALSCFERMRQGDCSPNTVTYACSLKACACIGSVSKGQELHSEIVLRFLETDLLVGNTLIDLYAKCNSLSEAQAVFDNLLNRDVVTWNALITGYMEHKMYQEGLRSFAQMQNEGISPDSVTFVCILRACAGLCEIKVGRAVDALISNKQFEGETFMGNASVDMYSKCGCLVEAEKAFDKLPSKDVISWNALIAGYAEHGPYNQAVKSLKEMQLWSVAQDATTYICILKACSKLGALEKGQRVHLKISERGLDTHPFVGSALVEFYGNCGALWEAEDTFDRVPDQDATLWNALIAGYVEQHFHEKALACVQNMRAAHLSPNSVTYSSCLKACGSQVNVVRGRELHNEASLMGIADDPFVGSALVNMYAECNALADAQNCFDKLSFQDIPSWNALIAGYVACGDMQQALKMSTFMRSAGASPNEVTYVCILKACSCVGVVEKGQAVHMELTLRGFIYNLYLGNALLDMYAKCGSLSEAWEVFVRLEVRDVISWNTIIKGYGVNHEGIVAVQVFEDMRKHCVHPDAVTFTCLLTACSRSNLVIRGQELFKLMSEEFGIPPSIHHYNCIIDLHARSGRLHEAHKFLQSMPCFPCEALWTVLLSACKNFVKGGVGFKCFDDLAHLYSKCATAYMLLTDICVASERWSTAHKLAEDVGNDKKGGAVASTFLEVKNKCYGPGQELDASFC